MANIDQSQLLKLTKDLIAFKSISPNQAGSIDYIETFLNNLGFVTTRVDRNQTSNLIARYGTEAPIFAFAGHSDVVPPGNLNEWQTHPFTLEEKDGHLYGRGICDMKGAIAGMLMAVKAFLEKHPDFQNTLMLLITSDEESTATDGTTAIVDYLVENNLKIDYCVIGEPTSVETLGDVIKVGRRGSLTGNLEITGKQGHIAYPHLCDNPIHKFAGTLNELSQIKLDQGNEIFPPSSLQFANINSGLGVNNVIPSNLYANFNIRYNPLHTSEDMQAIITQVLDKHKLNYTISWKNSAKPFYTKPGKLNSAVKAAIEECTHLIPELKTDGGTSDGRFLINVCAELLEFGLTNQSIHQINENIPTNDLSQLTNIYSSTLENIFYA